MDHGVLGRRADRARQVSRAVACVAAFSALVAGPTLVTTSVAAPVVVAPTAAPPAFVRAALPAFPSEMVLQIGSRGPQVVVVQRALVRHGYVIGRHVLGLYGRTTADAVLRFKRAHPGLGPTNRVGPRTYAALTAVAGGGNTGERGPEAFVSYRSRAPEAWNTPGYARWYAAQRLRAYGWGAGQMGCLRPMWIAESHWGFRESSGQYVGIPQTTVGVAEKYGFTWSAYRATPEIQVEVGLRYIRDRYGSPCKAWSFWRAQGARQDSTDPQQWWGGWY
ncbi:MAG: hypothetical protein F2842_06330 [Actinobacteria bacterium]|uniref:Unannotated protein n=1 Tax=freshwater metagenome TaxID=449393 RepID=A0A6J7JZ15_9ZZZZ|nr:hypothetical protein [Actinomycetota bacterium]MSW41811.1 hypothetical protein [Actinomycetota bacterium]